MAGALQGDGAVTAVGAIVAWLAGLVIAYVYVGYPALLWLMTRWRKRVVRREDITPSVTLLISAFNEDRVIRDKIENALRLDYAPGRLEIIVISDASTDDTDAIVSSYVDRGVKLLRMAERRGKTFGLNAAMQQARGEIVVFSDANILYRSDAVRKLVRNFADPSVGCVTGNSCYAEDDTAAAAQENRYWRYEQAIRRWESDLGSTVGSDGAIFAIRRELYTPLPADAINDLVVPLQIVARGYRAVFEPEAVGVEPSAGNFAGEFRRKRRIVNRSWRGVRSVPQVLKPCVVGIFAWQVWSHKILRWLILPIFLLGALGCVVAFPLGWVYRIGAAGCVASLALAAAGAFAKQSLGRSARLAQGIFYFYMVNLAAFLGVLRAVFGRVDVLWTPERR